MDGLRVFKLAVPRDNEYTPESASGLFSSMLYFEVYNKLNDLLFKNSLQRLSLEVAVIDQKVTFYAVVNSEFGDYWDSQFQASYPQGVAVEQSDYMEKIDLNGLLVNHLSLAKSFYYPIRTYKEFSDIDPLTLLLGVMSKAKIEDFMVFQIVMASSGHWRRIPERMLSEGVKQSDGTTAEISGKSLIAQKIGENGFWTAIRLAANSYQSLASMSSAFGIVNRGDGNNLKLRKPSFWERSRWRDSLVFRKMNGFGRNHVLSISELATLWHMPGKSVQLHNIVWAKNLTTEAPDNLPVYNFVSDDDKLNINFFGKTYFRGDEMVFGIKRDDRLRHMYVIGKSGVGKSTLLENMAISDMKKGQGLAFLDPHGSSVEHLLNYVPKNRINDVVYFDPADSEYPISLNILEVTEPGHREFVASGIVSIFNKLYGHSWGPRLEYILRNTLLTLTEVPGTTLPNIIDMLTNREYRDKTVRMINDPVMIKYWNDEFNMMDPKKSIEEVSSILNKVGQFVSSPLIRRIISPSKSSIDFETIMNDGKILLVNLSQGKMGEDNAALMGAMIITKIQLSAMRRAKNMDVKWRDFFLYVDEFQNFATKSFIKILSEARKYRLGLTLANQYVEQIDEDVMAAIIGNVGTLATFLVGSTDAQKLEKEFAEVFTFNDLTHLNRGEIILKLAIDGLTSRPFFAKTLPPASSSNQNKDKVITVSRERWGNKGKSVGL